MSILTSQEIKAEVINGNLIHNFIHTNIEACSYDMRIGTIFTDSEKINSTHTKAYEPVIIKPGEIVSFFTLEELDLPEDISATAFAINSQSSRGLLVLNPGHIDPGFKGPLTVKAVNLRKTQLAVERKSVIFTVIFDKLQTKTDNPYNRNMLREDRERHYNEKNVESAPKSLADLMVFTENNPFPTINQVNTLVKEHWLSRLTVFIMVITFIAAIIAALASVHSMYNDNDQESSAINIIELINKIDTLETRFNVIDEKQKEQN